MPPPVRVAEVMGHLDLEGVPRNDYGLQELPASGFGFALFQRGDSWEVVYYERGDATPVQSFPNETEAVAAFIQRVMKAAVNGRRIISPDYRVGGSKSHIQE